MKRSRIHIAMTEYLLPIIALAESDADISRCFPCVQELRPHLNDEAELIRRVRRQQETSGYRLAFIAESDAGGEIVCIAGFRIADYLAWGRGLYLDDLATLSAARKKGYAGRMLDWLEELAREEKCDSFHLDSGVMRFDAHRLYLAKRFSISSHHFSKDLA